MPPPTHRKHFWDELFLSRGVACCWCRWNLNILIFYSTYAQFLIMKIYCAELNHSFPKESPHFMEFEINIWVSFLPWVMDTSIVLDSQIVFFSIQWEKARDHLVLGSHHTSCHCLCSDPWLFISDCYAMTWNHTHQLWHNLPTDKHMYTRQNMQNCFCGSFCIVGVSRSTFLPISLIYLTNYSVDGAEIIGTQSMNPNDFVDPHFSSITTTRLMLVDLSKISLVIFHIPLSRCSTLTH